MKKLRWLSVAILAINSPIIWAQAVDCPALLDHQVEKLTGGKLNLCAYKNHVVLVVNTASECGYTSQYKALEAVFQKYREQKFVVIGVPSNQFGAQEPGDNKKVAEFCQRNFGVKFPMTEKAVVAGSAAMPLFAQLKASTGQTPQWNFHKYLIGRDGKTVTSFASAVTPNSQPLVSAIEASLKRSG